MNRIIKKKYFTGGSVQPSTEELAINQAPTKAPNMLSTSTNGSSGAGTALGIFGSVFGNIKNAWNQDQMNRQAFKNRVSTNAQLYDGYNNSVFNPYEAVFAMGGMVPMLGNVPVELEKDEVFQTPDGQMGQVDAPSHAQGGIDLNLPQQSFVWSDRLKTKNGKTFADEAAKLARLKAKYEKILNS